MIGLPALLIGVGFVLFPLLAGLAVYFDWRAKRGKRHLIAFVALGVFLLLVGNRFINNLRYHHEIRTLTVDEVSRLEVNGKAITEAKDLAAVTNALNDADWFTFNHGGAARSVPFVVHFKSGQQSSYTVAYYKRAEGAVVGFSWRWQNGTHISYGEAFCPKLAQALEQAGIPLPKD